MSTYSRIFVLVLLEVEFLVEVLLHAILLKRLLVLFNCKSVLDFIY